MGTETITVSKRAAEELGKLIRSYRDSHDTDVYLRLYATGGGCCGTKYGMAMDESVRKDDKLIKHEGVTIVVDSSSIEYLDGSNVEYVESAAGNGFMITNPKDFSLCGCGMNSHSEKK